MYRGSVTGPTAYQQQQQYQQNKKKELHWSEIPQELKSLDKEFERNDGTTIRRASRCEKIVLRHWNALVPLLSHYMDKDLPVALGLAFYRTLRRAWNHKAQIDTIRVWSTKKCDPNKVFNVLMTKGHINYEEIDGFFVGHMLQWPSLQDATEAIPYCIGVTPSPAVFFNKAASSAKPSGGELRLMEGKYNISKLCRLHCHPDLLWFTIQDHFLSTDPRSILRNPKMVEELREIVHFASLHGYIKLLELIFSGESYGRQPDKNCARQDSFAEEGQRSVSDETIAGTGSSTTCGEAVRCLTEQLMTTPPRSSSSSLPSPLFCAVEGGNPKLIPFLVSHGGDLTVQNQGYSLLHWSAFFGVASVARTLVDFGSDINQRRKSDGITPLHMVKTARMARAFVLLGADVKALDSEGLTPMGSAVQHGLLPVVEQLGRLGASFFDVNPKTGANVLHIAAGCDQKEILEWVVYSRTELGDLNDDGVDDGNEETTKTEKEEEVMEEEEMMRRMTSNCSIASGPGVDTSRPLRQKLLPTLDDVDAQGNTPLHAGTKMGFKVCLKLLQLGADPRKYNRKGEIPADLAEESGNQMLVSLLGGGAA